MQTTESLVSFLYSFVANKKNFCSCIKPRQNVTVINTIIKKGHFAFSKAYIKNVLKKNKANGHFRYSQVAFQWKEVCFYVLKISNKKKKRKYQMAHRNIYILSNGKRHFINYKTYADNVSHY